MANENSISRKAVTYVINYEKKRGNEVVDMQTNSAFKGFDVLSFSKNKDEIRAIEVKGTESEGGIPDLFETEVTRTGKLIATHIYLVQFNKEKNVQKLFIIPATNFKPEDFSETRHYRIRSNFYTRTNKLKDFEVLSN